TVTLDGHRADDVMLVVDRRHVMVELHRDAALLHPGAERLPHLPRAEPRVVELLDQRRRLRAAQMQRGEQRLPEREVLDPLHRAPAPAAGISEPGIPDASSVYERKNAS